jgi:hypothetical protein
MSPQAQRHGRLWLKPWTRYLEGAAGIQVELNTSSAGAGMEVAGDAFADVEGAPDEDWGKTESGRAYDVELEQGHQKSSAAGRTVAGTMGDSAAAADGTVDVFASV